MSNAANRLRRCNSEPALNRRRYESQIPVRHCRQPKAITALLQARITVAQQKLTTNLKSGIETPTDLWERVGLNPEAGIDDLAAATGVAESDLVELLLLEVTVETEALKAEKSLNFKCNRQDLT